MSQVPETALDAQELVESVIIQGEAAEAPPRPGEVGDVMVPRSVRWPLDLDQRVKQVAKERGLTMSQLMREWAEAELAALAHDQPISRADAIRALSSVRPLGGAA